VADLNGDGWLDFSTAGSEGVHLFFSHRGRRFVDASAVLPAPIPAIGRPITLTPGGNPDFFFLGWTEYWYYIARNVRPFSLTGPPRVRRHLSGSQPP
jgi:hypothetical protein